MSRKNELVVGLLVAGAAAFLTAIAIPNLPGRPLRAPINSCINNLRQIDGATAEWAAEHGKDTNAVPTWNDILPYLKFTPECQSGGKYTLGSASNPPTCSVPKHILP